jgi:Uma2 family endonuclease
MSTQPKHLVTVEEYLAAEAASVQRHEYLDGEVFAMAGASPRHSVISVNLSSALNAQLRDSNSNVRNGDMRLRTSPTGLYSYADVVISCAPERFDRDTLLNPIVIIEVLSETTGNYDRSLKFERYRQIPSFREYLVVAQDRVYVEHHVRSDSSEKIAWTMREFTSLEDVISLESVGANLPCSAIYAEVNFQIETDLQESS